MDSKKGALATSTDVHALHSRIASLEEAMSVNQVEKDEYAMII